MSTKTKTFEECCDEIAKKKGFKKLFIDGYAPKPWIKEAAELYVSEKIKEKEHEKNRQIDNIIKKRNEKIKRAIELAREYQPAKIDGIEYKFGKQYTEQEIIDKLSNPK